MVNRYSTKNGEVKVNVNPGVCGFMTSITARSIDQKTAEIRISESNCKMISKLSRLLTKIDFAQVLAPIDKNPVYTAAAQAGLHPTCTMPAAVLKACEVALELAVPRDVQIYFDK